MDLISCSVQEVTFAITSSTCSQCSLLHTLYYHTHFIITHFIITHNARCEDVYFFCEPNGLHGIYCCVACVEYFKKTAKRANVIGTDWSVWNKKDYRVFRKRDWAVSYTRSLSLLQWSIDNPVRASKKGKKKRKSNHALPHPRDVVKKSPSKQEVLTKLKELTALVKTYVNEWWHIKTTCVIICFNCNHTLYTSHLSVCRLFDSILKKCKRSIFSFIFSIFCTKSRSHSHYFNMFQLLSCIVDSTL